MGAAREDFACSRIKRVCLITDSDTLTKTHVCLWTAVENVIYPSVYLLIINPWLKEECHFKNVFQFTLPYSSV